MAERKVQSKYIPPDFDHRVLKAVTTREPKQKEGKKKKLDTVRLMLPFNVCCAKCNTYMYRGRKFNGRKEEGVDPDFMGMKIIRFHFRCEKCSSEIVYRTDPKTAGYVVVSGARENRTSAGLFNPLTGDEDKAKPDELDPVRKLEERALETKKEMETIRELEREMQLSNARDVVARNLSQSSERREPQQDQLDDEERAALEAFRMQKRQAEVDNDKLRPIPETHSQIRLAADDLVPAIVVQKMVKKPKLTSFVAYADDDDD